MSWYRSHDDDDPGRLRSKLREQEYELDRLREDQSRREEQTQREYDERRSERAEQMREAQHTADSWADAFRKNRALYQRELNEELADEARYRGDADADPTLAQHFDGGAFWKRALAEIDEAERLWKAAQAEIAPQIHALEQQIEELRERARMEVAAQVRALPSGNCTAFAEALEADDPSAWLDW